MGGTSIFEAVFDDDQFDALLFESEHAARLAHRLRERVLAAERTRSADLDDLRREADEARAVADDLQRRLGTTANRIVAQQAHVPAARRRFVRWRRLTPSVESSRA